MVRRTREFDRSAFFGDLFSTLAPHQQVSLPTNSEWKANRRLTADTMSPQFIDMVSGPRVYERAPDMIELWKVKSRLAQGRPFSIIGDMRRAGIDFIWATTFGDDIRVTKSQIQGKCTNCLKINEVHHLSLAENTNTPIEIPTAPEPVEFTSFVALAASCQIPVKSPFPRMHHWLELNLRSSLRTAVRQKEEILTRLLRKASGKFAHNNGPTRAQANLRELQLAKDENRKSQIVDSRAMRDELLGLIVAGGDTTDNTTLWALKQLTDHQVIQSNIRDELRAAFPDAAKSTINPPIHDLVSTDLPYLDAFIEEIHRYHTVSAVNIRRATVDTQVLGYPITAGTDLFLVNTGPDYMSAPFPIDESQRSKSSQEIKDRFGSWDPEDIGAFKPERWPVTSEDSKMIFNPRAGPSHPFGAGARGCFSRRLANLTLRILISLIVWNLELRKVPPELSSYAVTAKVEVVHEPRMCFVRLADVNF